MELFVFEDNEDYYLVPANEIGHALYLIEQEYGEETRRGAYLVDSYDIDKLHVPVIRLSRVG